MTRSGRGFLWIAASVLLIPPCAYILTLVLFYTGWPGAGQVLISVREFIGGLGVNENTLMVQRDRDVFPLTVRATDGSPYTGRVYGTIAGGSLLKDCIEWTGQYRNGVRHGTFEFARNCYEAPQRYEFQDGVAIHKAP